MFQAAIKARFPPNYIFISFVYLTLDDMAVSQSILVSKSPCDRQKSPKSLNSFKIPLFRHVLWRIVKAPATNIALQSEVNFNFAAIITKLNLFFVYFLFNSMPKIL
jgi:hypothetical protein